jgi:hypothetical protein
MLNGKTMPGPRRPPPFNIYHLAFIISVLLCPGCGLNLKPPPPKPQLYRVQGRVLDATTRQGLASARVLLRAAIPTELDTRALAAVAGPAPQGRGAVQLTAYAYTSASGEYRVELSEGFEILRSAARIRIEVSKGGYLVAGMDLPPPGRPEKVYGVPDILMAPGDPAPASSLPPGVILPGMAPAASGPPEPRVLPPTVGASRLKPKENPIPWK